MKRLLILTMLVPAGLTPSGVAGPITQDACAGTVTGPTVWVQRSEVLENLLFAHGSLWVSAGAQVLRLGPSGEELPGLKSTSGSTGGLAVDEDGVINPLKVGWIYVGTYSGLPGAILGDGEAAVVRFDPDDPTSTAEVYAGGGFSMANGLLLTDDGTIFTSNDFAPNALNPVGLVTIPPNGAPTPFTDVYATNGLVELDGDLFAAVTFDQRSPIARIPLDDPGAADHDIQLTFGVASLQPAVHPEDNDPSEPLLGVKGLDDMTSVDGLLYPVANGTGELLEVDPADGSACLITGGFQNPSSVRVAPEGGPFADGDPATIDFYVTSFDGTVRTVLYTPA